MSADDVARADPAVEDAAGDHSAPERVVVGVEDQGRERFFALARGRRNLVNYGLDNIVDPVPSFAEHRMASSGSEPQIMLYLLLYPVDIGRGQVDLVDHRDDGESCSMAAYRLAMVWASTPWEASTRRSTPSQEARARDTS